MSVPLHRHSVACGAHWPDPPRLRWLPVGLDAAVQPGRGYVERSSTGRRIGFVEPHQAALLPDIWSFVEALGAAVAKCHLAPDVDPLSTAWSRLRQSGRLVPIYTVRDWRDVVHSWSCKFEQSLDEVFRHPRWALNLASLESWLAQGAHVQHYETLVQDPIGALRQLVTWADLPLDEDVLRTAATAAVRHPRPAPDVDPRTLLHPDHVAGPGGGQWRQWSAEGRALAAGHIAPLMRRFGYTWDHA